MFCPRCHRKYDDDSTFCHFDGEPLLARPNVDRIPVGKTRHEGVLLGGRYQVRGYVGKGAMARVYLAEDLHAGHPVAVKVLDKTAARDPEAGVRFQREARAIQAIGHPNVIEIFDVGERDDGMPYLVMEFLFGESLGGLLKREGRLSADILTRLSPFRARVSWLQGSGFRLQQRDSRPRPEVCSLKPEAKSVSPERAKHESEPRSANVRKSVSGSRPPRVGLSHRPG
jgi:hypothetical protein